MIVKSLLLILSLLLATNAWGEETWLNCKADFNVDKVPGNATKEYIFRLDIEKNIYWSTGDGNTEESLGSLWVYDTSLGLLDHGDLDRRTLILSMTNPMAEYLKHLSCCFTYKCELVSEEEGKEKSKEMIKEGLELQKENKIENKI